jgi:hypothetical protein
LAVHHSINRVDSTYIDVVACALLFAWFSHFTAGAEYEVTMLVRVEILHPDGQWRHFLSKSDLEVELVVGEDFKQR